MEHKIVEEQIEAFSVWLRREEREQSTARKYLRDIRALASWLGTRPVTKENLSEWKDAMLRQGYAPVTINSKLAAIHQFLDCCGWGECKVKYLKVQRQAFRSQNRELTKKDYETLIEEADRRGQRRLALMLETLGATGIRVSEIRYITVEAARQGYAEIFLKGKIRRILLSGKLRRKLLQYAKEKEVASGEIFLTRGGKSLGRKQIWGELKILAEHAGVDPRKVFPHNFRHLFAVTFYGACSDIVKLADVLGHASMETTRLYLTTTGREHELVLEKLGLVK